MDGMNVVLEHDLLRRMIEAYCRQPSSIGEGPGPGTMVNPLVAQKKALQMLPGLGQHTDCRRPRSDQIAHRFVASVGDPDRRQLSSTVQLRQHQGIAAI